MSDLKKRRFNLWWIIPPLLLLLVSTLHPFRVHFTHLDRWEGGGFGMFTSLDRRSNRSLRLILPTENGEIPAFLFPWKQDRRRIVTLPDRDVLLVELEAKKDQDWTLYSTEIDKSFSGLSEIKHRNSGSFIRTYAGEGFNDDNPVDRYSSFALPENLVEEDGDLVRLSGNPRLDVHRLIYKGDGVFSSQLLSSSELQD